MSALTVRPLTPSRWRDFEQLFGSNGACGGCWCMWWRMPQKAYLAAKGAGTKRAFKKIVEEGPPPGLLAYTEGEAVGWCALAPRSEYPRLDNSRLLAPVDDVPVWSVTCFFVRRDWRKRGVTVALLKEAARYAGKRGARVVEGYPTDTKTTQPGAFVFHGLLGGFERAGFKEVARRSRSRPIVRRRIAAR